jgi:integrase/recombinase XerD
MDSDRAVIPASTDDDTLIRLWLHGRSPHTQRAYTKDAARFRAFVGKPLGAVTLSELQAFADSLTDLALSSQAQALASVKSLFAFGHRVGYLPFDVGKAVRLPAKKETLAERILPEAAVVRMLALEPNERNRVILRLLYASGMRVSELCRLTWRDVQERSAGGQVVAFGKGGKTRSILLPASVWDDLIAIRSDAGEDAPVFPSRKGGKMLTSVQVLRIVPAAAQRAGISGDVSPHWLRHAHASHAPDRGAPVHLVQQTLGHRSLTTTSRYTHARPSESSAKYLAI